MGIDFLVNGVAVTLLLLVCRPTGSNIITIHLWHKGYFVDEPRFDYAHGVCQSFEGWDVDGINSIEIGKLVKSLGYASFKCLWYRYPALGLFNGRRPFNEDADVIEFLKDVKGHDEVEFFVEHWVDNQIHVQEGIEKGGGEISVEVLSDGFFSQPEVLSVLNHYEQSVEQPVEQTVEQTVEQPVEQIVEHPVEQSVDQSGLHSVTVETVVVEESFPPKKSVGVESVVIQQSEVVQEAVVEEEEPFPYSDEEEDDEYEPATDEDVDSDDVSLDDPDYDERWDWASVLPPVTTNNPTLNLVQIGRAHV